MSFVAPVRPARHALVAAHRAQDAKFASAREYGRTGVLQGSTAQKLMQTYASKKASTLALGALTPVPSYAEGVRLLKAGQIDTLVADELLIPKDAAIALRPEQLTLEPYVWSCARAMRRLSTRWTRRCTRFWAAHRASNWRRTLA